MKLFRLHHLLTLTVLTPVLALAACAASSDGPEATASEPIIDGTPVLTDKLGTAVIFAVSGSSRWGCSGTMLNDVWMLTAHHCVTDGNATTGGTAIAPSGVTATVNGQTATGIQIVRHPGLDVALVQLGSTILAPSGRPYANRLYTGTASSLVNQSLYCQGVGVNTFDQHGFGALRSANLKVSQLDGTSYRIVPNGSSQIEWHGDSGSSCARTLNGQTLLTGVQSTCEFDSTQVLWCDQVSSDGFRDWANGVVGGAGSAGNPTGYVRSEVGTAVVYRAPDNHVRELYLGAQGWTVGDPTTIAGAAATDSDLAAYIRPDSQNAVVYRAADNHIHELSLPFQSGPWFAADLSSVAGATIDVVGNPSAYSRADEIATVVYRGTDRSIFEMSLQKGGQWRVGNLSAIAGAPAAASDPFGYVRADGGNAVIYTAVDSHIHELYLGRPGQSWSVGDISAISGAPLSAGRPRGYTRTDGVTAVVYRGTEGDIHEIALVPVAGTTWSAGDLSTIAGAPAAASDPVPYVRNDHASAVVYRGVDNHVHELSLVSGSPWTHKDLTALTGAPSATDTPAGYVRADGLNVVVFRNAANGHVSELALVGTAWQVGDLTGIAGGP